ncbi:MAG: PspA/IM30 family protein, partial [Armatimonadota bacterium]
MFQRLVAALRSILGLFIRGMEKPEIMLEQYIDDLRAQVPRLNDAVAEVIKTEILLRGQVETLERRIAELDKQIVTALKMGPQYEEDAKTLIAAMERDKESLEDTREQWEAAKRAAEQAKQAREEYLRNMDGKIQQALQAISRAKQAEMQERVSGLLMSFQLGDQTDVLERMREKIDERAAKAQARVELATTGVD